MAVGWRLAALLLFALSLFHLWSMVEMAAIKHAYDRSVYGLGIRAVLLLVMGIGAHVLSRRYGPVTSEQLHSVGGSVLLVAGTMMAVACGVSVLPYFTGQSCSMALIAWPGIPIGLGLAAIGGISLYEARRQRRGKT